MKNVYVSPEVELIALAPVEGIAALDITLGRMDAATGSVADIDVSIDLFS